MSRVIRKLGFDTIRSYCIERKLYINGTNEEYNNLYDFVSELNNQITDFQLWLISQDIKEHSITDLQIIDIFTGLNRESYYEVL